MRRAAGLLVLLPREGMYAAGKLAGLAWLPVSSSLRGLLRKKLREAPGFTNLRSFWLSFLSTRPCRLYGGRPSGDFSL